MDDFSVFEGIGIWELVFSILLRIDCKRMRAEFQEGFIFTESGEDEENLAMREEFFGGFDGGCDIGIAGHNSGNIAFMSDEEFD